MGLHVHVVTNNYKEIYSGEFYRNDEDVRSKMHLSREFAELLARLDVSIGESELKQVEKIVKVDLSPLWQMANYHDEITDVPDDNISRVLVTVVHLIDKLKNITDLKRKIKPYDDDIDFEWYFSDFTGEELNNAPANNFEQDLKNLERQLVYVTSKGATKVWFNIE